MIWLDAAILVCLIVSLFRGLYKGFTAQIVAIFSIIVGIWMAFKCSTLLCSYMAPHIEVSDKILQVIAFVLIIIVVIVVFHLLGKIIHATFKLVMLGWLDSLLGAVFATFKTALIIGVLLVLFDSVNSQFHLVDEAKLEQSVTYKPVRNVACATLPFIKKLI